MAERSDRMSDAARHVDPRWDEARVELALVGLRGRRRRRGITRAIVSASILVALVSGGVFLFGTEGRSRGPAGVARAEQSVFLTDGSTAVALSSEARMRLVEESPRRVVMEVSRGGARFDVAPRADREFEVLAGRVRIVVVGTSFTVRRSGDRTGVRVLAGRVRVEWEGGRAELDPGEEGWFPRADVASPPAAVVPAPMTSDLPPQKAPASPRHGWRTLAEQGGFDEAYELLRALPAGSVRDEPQDLLLAADAARLSGHASDALPYLRRVTRDHARDPRAPLAAFTMGRVLLAELGRPREAAEAFSQARSLAPGGSLAEDALAREVEAWSRAAESGRARERAEEYVRLYPQGRRIRAVRTHGGLGPQSP